MIACVALKVEGKNRRSKERYSLGCDVVWYFKACEEPERLLMK
jgi:hypothetical protein